jgi:hypothetical protein
MNNKQWSCEVCGSCVGLICAHCFEAEASAVRGENEALVQELGKALAVLKLNCASWLELSQSTSSLLLLSRQTAQAQAITARLLSERCQVLQQESDTHACDEAEALRESLLQLTQQVSCDRCKLAEKAFAVAAAGADLSTAKSVLFKGLLTGAGLDAALNEGLQWHEAESNRELRVCRADKVWDNTSASNFFRFSEAVAYGLSLSQIDRRSCAQLPAFIHCNTILISFAMQVRQLHELLQADIDSDTVQQVQQYVSNIGDGVPHQENTPVVTVVGMSSLAGLPLPKSGDINGIPDEVNVAGKGIASKSYDMVSITYSFA